MNIAGNAPAGSPFSVFTIDAAQASFQSGSRILFNTELNDASVQHTDLLVLSHAVADAPGTLVVTNFGGQCGDTGDRDGIRLVQAINGATTTPNNFTLPAGELRAGAFDYDLFRGGLNPSNFPNDWFLRSDFVSSGGGGGGGGVGGGGSVGGGGGGAVPLPIPPFPIDPPPSPLPPGVAFPIIGPELATYGVVQPLARQLGLSILGTLDDRVGDTYEPDGCAVAPAVASAAAETSAVDLPTKKPATVPTKKPGAAPCPLFSPSVWGRVFGQTIHNNYQAFAAPSASGDLGGFQGGIDLLRGSLIAGQYERAGLYGAYGDVHADMNGLVTNPAATAYVLTHTGSMNLNSWSAGGYWTHTGSGGWYLDAVLQGTWYYGSASTQFARLNTDGTGFIASLEGGYPFAWPQLGPGFVIEPQGQILWQKVSFRHDYDGLGDVALGDTTGPSGRRTWLASAAIAGALAVPGVASASTYVFDVTTISGTVVDLNITTSIVDSVLTPGDDITKVTGTVGGVNVSNYTGTWGPNGDQVSDGLYLDPYLNHAAHIDSNGTNVFTVQNPPGSGGANFEIDNIFYAGTGNSHLSYQGGIGLLLANGASYYISANNGGLTASGPGAGDGQYYDWVGGKSQITSAPEPSTWAMMLLGFAGLGFAGYRASRKNIALAA